MRVFVMFILIGKLAIFWLLIEKTLPELTGFENVGINEKISSSEEQVVKEMILLNFLEEFIREHNINVSLIYSNSKFGEEGRLKQLDTMSIHTINMINDYNSSTFSNIDEKQLKEIFEFAKKINVMPVFSQERYAKDGALSDMIIITPHVNIVFSDGKTKIIIHDKNHEIKVNDFKHFFDAMYERPITIHKTTLGNNGEVIEKNTSGHDIKKVTINKSHQMPANMKIHLAEILKRTYGPNMNDEKKFLRQFRYKVTTKYPRYEWQIIIDGENHRIKSESLMEMSFLNRTFTVFATSL